MNRRVATLAAGLLVATPAVAVAAPSAQAATTCRATVTVTDAWAGAYVATVTASRAGALAVIPASGTATQVWTTSGATGTAAGFVATGSPDDVPAVSLDGSACTVAPAAVKITKKCKTGKNGKKTCKTITKTVKKGKTTKSPTGKPTTTTTSKPPTTTTTTSKPPTTTPPAGAAPALKVVGNKLVTSTGRTYRLLGVDRSSGEYACVQGKGQWDGGPVDQASVDAMKTWNIHAVRIPLNEECWLGVNGTPSGATYQQGVKSYVDLLVANGITPVLDLHWTHGAYTTGPDWHCKDATATCQKPMPDAEYTPKFWAGVATMFKGNDAVVFDLFNEPYPEIASNWDQTKGWTCWRDGGMCPGLGYEAAGMQSLVDAVRGTGATNVIMLGGLEWANNLRSWLQYKPTDPKNNLAASWHSYSFNACKTAACWDEQIAPVAQQVPVIMGEFGQDDCGFTYMGDVLKWADAHGLSHLAWTWNPWGCSTGAVLIKDWKGTPEPGVGEGVRAHLLAEDPYSS
ncbi:MAG: cellulase family glycosylhydrolase [Kineosporiaceae bacterium]